MKKYLKTAFLSIIIFYFILSVTFNFYIHFISKNQLKPYTEMLISNGPIEITPSNNNSENVLSNHDLITIFELSNSLKTSNLNILILLACIIIGIIIGIIKVLKEFSKLKYLLYFILGYIIYMGILIMFIHFFQQIYNLDLILIISNIIIKFSLLYTLFFMIVIIANMIIAKFQVKKLNKLLNNHKKQD